jgi:hypothetical protein
MSWKKVFRSGFIYFVDDLRDTPHCPSPSVLQVGIAKNTNFKEFLPVELRKLPEDICCSRILKPVHISTTVDNENLCESCHSGKIFPARPRPDWDSRNIRRRISGISRCGIPGRTGNSGAVAQQLARVGGIAVRWRAGALPASARQDGLAVKALTGNGLPLYFPGSWCTA